jgi:hypothetical protein
MSLWCSHIPDSTKARKKKLQQLGTPVSQGALIFSSRCLLVQMRRQKNQSNAGSRVFRCAHSTHSTSRAWLTAATATKEILHLVKEARILDRKNLILFAFLRLWLDSSAACGRCPNRGGDEHGFEKRGGNFHNQIVFRLL